MADVQSVLEYKCPSCGAPLIFDQTRQQMQCHYCDSSFDMDAVLEYNRSLMEKSGEQFQWEDFRTEEFTQQEQDSLRSYTCPSCGGEIVSDEQTAATFCPYCENPTILSNRLSGGIKPDGVIPFKTTKEDAEKAFLNMCKGKPLLPKMFTQQQRIEKISGIYVPFWLYDCAGSLQGTYKATRVHSWSDAQYHYTKTDHFLLNRAATGSFSRIPLDASSKIDDDIMESIEPYRYDEMVDFDTAYLSGFFADKYDVEAVSGEDRIKQRVSNTMDNMVQSTFLGYSSVVPALKQLNISESHAKYVLLPVWMLHTKYKDKTYVFAMNGQTGKMTGTFPICSKRSTAWFLGVAAGVTMLVSLVQMLLA